MNSTSRIVRRLRLRAPHESAIRRAVVLLEDAMRMASLPDDAGRIVIVRKLELGRIDSRVSPQIVAMRLESAFERVAPECVYAGSAGAHAASAVWFRDALDAHARLALRLAAGVPADAWYWKLAVRAWEPGTPLPQALRAIMLSVAALPEARAALPGWTADLTAAGHAECLAAALRVEDVPSLARVAGMRIPALAGVPRHPTDARRARAPAPETDDPRHELLNALLDATGVKTARRHSASLAAWNGQSQRGRASPRRAATSNVGAQSAGEPPHASSTLAGQTRNVRAPGETILDAETPAGSVHGANPVLADDRSALAPRSPWVSPDSLTRAGGLLFLIPVLQRLGYPEWLNAQPEWTRCDIARRVLAAALIRLDISPADPAWLLARPSRTDSAPRRFVAPAPWHEELTRRSARTRTARIESTQTLWDASGRLLLGAWSDRCPRSLMGTWRRAEAYTASFPETDRAALVTSGWLVAARRWLRRRARIGLADLVLRSAILSLTPTHVDVQLEMRACELRVRRAGLDFDPGWVPWFGRVVTFHYR